MLKKIIENYEKFPDSLITDIHYNYDHEDNSGIFILNVVIRCMNFMNKNNYERVKLQFHDVILFNFSQINGFPGFMMNEIYVSENDGLITFDFFPIDHFDYLEENPNSEFIIKCKAISYEVLSSE